MQAVAYVDKRFLVVARPRNYRYISRVAALSAQPFNNTRRNNVDKTENGGHAFSPAVRVDKLLSRFKINSVCVDRLGFLERASHIRLQHTHSPVQYFNMIRIACNSAVNFYLMRRFARIQIKTVSNKLRLFFAYGAPIHSRIEIYATHVFRFFSQKRHQNAAVLSRIERRDNAAAYRPNDNCATSFGCHCFNLFCLFLFFVVRAKEQHFASV